MSKGVFLCVGTGGHVLPAYNVIKSMLNQGLDKKNILVVTDERGCLLYTSDAADDP